MLHRSIFQSSLYHFHYEVENGVLKHILWLTLWLTYPTSIFNFYTHLTICSSYTALRRFFFHQMKEILLRRASCMQHIHTTKKSPVYFHE